MAKSDPRPVPVPARASQQATSRQDFWRAVLEEWRRSGLRQAEFCRRRGIPPGTLRCWKYKVARAAEAQAHPAAGEPTQAPARAAFVPVRVVPPRGFRRERAPEVSTDADGEIEIVLERGRLVRVRGRVDVPWLAQVLDRLAALPC